MERIKEVSREKFEESILEDSFSKSFARFPSRFIILDNLESLSDILKFLEKHVDTAIKLSDYCGGEDVLPDVNSAIEEAIKLVKDGKKVLLIGISEFMRFKEGDSEFFLNRLSGFEIDPRKNGRLLIPLFGVESIFLKFWNKIPDSEFENRKKPAIIIPSEYKEKSVEVYVTKDSSLIKNPLPEQFLLVQGFKEYLKLWEDLKITNDRNKVLLVSERTYGLIKETPKGTVIVERIENPKDFLKKIFAIDVPFEFKQEEGDYWERLNEEIVKRKITSFEDFVKSYLNVATFNPQIFSKWEKLTDFDRWLLTNWAKFKLGMEEPKGYLSLVLRDCSNYAKFEELIWLKIFEVKDSNFLDERRNLIKSLGLSHPPEALFEKLSKISDPHRRLQFLTNSSFQEKREIIKTVAECLRKGSKLEELLPQLEKIYPELYYYLQPLILDDKLRNYITSYILAKICDDFMYLENIIKDQHNRVAIFEYKPRNEICEKIDAAVICIDGLGLEWSGLIYNYLRDKGYDVKIEVAKSTIPTTTDFNKFSEKDIVIRDLDFIYHRKDLDYPDYIVREIDTLIKILDEEVKPRLKNYGKAIITSDHGSTRFSGWPKEAIELKTDYEVQRDGRYVFTSQQPPKSPEYVVELLDGNFLAISTTHKIFKGGKKPVVETHGGATIEEALVPVIRVESKKESRIKIEILDKEISILKPAFRIRVSPPAVEKIYAIVQGKIVEALKIDFDIWQFDLSSLDLKIGLIEVELQFGTQSEVIEIKVKGGIEEEDMFRW